MRERERDSLPLAGSNYWLSLDPWNKIADRNLSLSGLCHIFLSLAFPSTLPLLWIPFTWADRSLKWGGEKKTLSHIGLPSGSVQIIFFRVGNYRERDTELKILPGLFQVWSEENFDKPKERLLVFFIYRLEAFDSRFSVDVDVPSAPAPALMESNQIWEGFPLS